VDSASELRTLGMAASSDLPFGWVRDQSNGEIVNLFTKGRIKRGGLPPVRAADAHLPPLPAGWRVRLDPQSTEAWYENVFSHEAQWERPKDRGDVGLPPLPPGWTTCFDGEGDPYFTAPDGSSQWDRPANAAPTVVRPRPLVPTLAASVKVPQVPTPVADPMPDALAQALDKSRPWTRLPERPYPRRNRFPLVPLARWEGGGDVEAPEGTVQWGCESDDEVSAVEHARRAGVASSVEAVQQIVLDCAADASDDEEGAVSEVLSGSSAASEEGKTFSVQPPPLAEELSRGPVSISVFGLSRVLRVPAASVAPSMEEASVLLCNRFWRSAFRGDEEGVRGCFHPRLAVDSVDFFVGTDSPVRGGGAFVELVDVQVTTSTSPSILRASLSSRDRVEVQCVLVVKTEGGVTVPMLGMQLGLSSLGDGSQSFGIVSFSGGILPPPDMALRDVRVANDVARAMFRSEWVPLARYLSPAMGQSLAKTSEWAASEEDGVWSVSVESVSRAALALQESLSSLFRGVFCGVVDVSAVDEGVDYRDSHGCKVRVRSVWRPSERSRELLQFDDVLFMHLGCVCGWEMQGTGSVFSTDGEQGRSAGLEAKAFLRLVATERWDAAWSLVLPQLCDRLLGESTVGKSGGGLLEEMFGSLSLRGFLLRISGVERVGDGESAQDGEWQVRSRWRAPLGTTEFVDTVHVTRGFVSGWGTGSHASGFRCRAVDSHKTLSLESGALVKASEETRGDLVDAGGVTMHSEAERAVRRFVTLCAGDPRRAYCKLHRRFARTIQRSLEEFEAELVSSAAGEAPVSSIQEVCSAAEESSSVSAPLWCDDSDAWIAHECLRAVVQKHVAGELAVTELETRLVTMQRDRMDPRSAELANGIAPGDAAAILFSRHYGPGRRGTLRRVDRVWQPDSLSEPEQWLVRWTWARDPWVEVTYEDGVAMRDGCVVGLNRRAAGVRSTYLDPPREDLVLLWRPVRRVQLWIRCAEVSAPSVPHDAYMVCLRALPCAEALDVLKRPGALDDSDSPGFWQCMGVSQQREVTSHVRGPTHGLPDGFVSRLHACPDPIASAAAGKFVSLPEAGGDSGVALVALKAPWWRIDSQSHVDDGGVTPLHSVACLRVSRSELARVGVLTCVTLCETAVALRRDAKRMPGFRPVHHEPPALPDAVRERFLSDDELDFSSIRKGLAALGEAPRGPDEPDYAYAMRMRRAVRRALRYDLKENERLNAGFPPSKAFATGVAKCHTFSLVLVAALRSGRVPARILYTLQVSPSVAEDRERSIGEEGGLWRVSRLERIRSATERLRHQDKGGSARMLSRALSSGRLHLSDAENALLLSLRERVLDLRASVHARPAEDRAASAIASACGFASPGGAWWTGLAGCGVDRDFVDALCSRNEADALSATSRHPGCAQVLKSSEQLVLAAVEVVLADVLDPVVLSSLALEGHPPPESEADRSKFSLQSTHATVDCWIEGVGWCPLEPQLLEGDSPLGSSAGDEIVCGVGLSVTGAVRRDVMLLRPYFGDCGRLIDHHFRSVLGSPYQPTSRVSTAQLGKLLAQWMGRSDRWGSEGQLLQLGRRLLELAKLDPEGGCSRVELAAMVESGQAGAVSEMLAWRLNPTAQLLRVWGTFLSGDPFPSESEPPGIEWAYGHRGSIREEDVQAVMRSDNAGVVIESDCVSDKWL
jgi:hypothetical protein